MSDLMSLEEVYAIKSNIYGGRYYCMFKTKQKQRTHLVAKYVMGLVWDSKKEVVHHKDGNKLNDMPDNLQVMTITEHRKLHTEGIKNPFYGLHHTKETKEKIGKANKGKLSGGLNHKYGVRLFGKDNPNYGHRWNEEQRKKASERSKGKVISEETRKKISESLKLSYLNNER